MQNFDISISSKYISKKNSHLHRLNGPLSQLLRSKSEEKKMQETFLERMNKKFGKTGEEKFRKPRKNGKS